jgi:hypothetical protein
MEPISIMGKLRYALGRALLTAAAVLTGASSLPEATAAEANSATYPAISVQADEQVDYNWAKLDSEARVVYVSSGARSLAFSMIDGDPRTVFRFSGADLHPTVIVELGRSEQVHRVTALFRAENVKLHVFLLNSLPRSPRDLGGAKPLACIFDRLDSGKAGVEFDPTNVRYVAVQWSRPIATSSPFEVAEVSAFGLTSPAELPPALPDIHFAGEGGIDFSNGLGTLAQPPVIVSVSP